MTEKLWKMLVVQTTPSFNTHAPSTLLPCRNKTVKSCPLSDPLSRMHVIPHHKPEPVNPPAQRDREENVRFFSRALATDTHTTVLGGAAGQLGTAAYSRSELSRTTCCLKRTSTGTYRSLAERRKQTTTTKNSTNSSCDQQAAAQRSILSICCSSLRAAHAVCSAFTSLPPLGKWSYER